MWSEEQSRTNRQGHIRLRGSERTEKCPLALTDGSILGVTRSEFVRIILTRGGLARWEGMT